MPTEVIIKEENGVNKAGIVDDRLKVDINSSLIHNNTHTSNDELRVYQENHICAANTTTVALGAGSTFTGAWQDCLNYQEVNISVFADQNSATNGLVISWSADGSTVGDTDTFTVYKNAGTNYTPNPAFRYIRVSYTNGNIPQTNFSLMTILRRNSTGGSFHRISDTLKDDSDGRLNLSVMKLRTAANTYVSGAATTNGNFKVSLEEFESGVSEDTKSSLKVSPQIVDEYGTVHRQLGDNIFKGAVIAITPEHHEIHCGDSYEFSHLVDLGNGATVDILIVVPSTGLSETHPGDSQDVKQYHFRGTIVTEAETTILFSEGATTSALGSSIAVYNRNRNSSYTDFLGIYHTPGLTATGTVIETRKTGASRAYGGTAGREEEWILKDNTKYLLRITNNTTTNNYVSVNCNYYVHPGI